MCARIRIYSRGVYIFNLFISFISICFEHRCRYLCLGIHIQPMYAVLEAGEGVKGKQLCRLVIAGAKAIHRKPVTLVSAGATVRLRINTANASLSLYDSRCLCVALSLSLSLSLSLFPYPYV